MEHLIIAREVEFTTSMFYANQDLNKKIRVSSMFLWFSDRKIDF